MKTEDFALNLRRRVFEHTVRNNGGYLSQACSAADMLALLYNEVLRLGPPILPDIPPEFPGVPRKGNDAYFTGAGYHGAPAADKDRFFISPAHYALVIYAALIEAARMSPQALEHFNRDGSSVEMIGAEHSPGMETTTGSLAQGLSVAAGVAWARKRRRESGLVWVFLSDGELQEGQTWEAFAVCVHHRIENLRIIIDANGQQCDGAMDSVLSIPFMAQRIAGFGLTTLEVDGHDLGALRKACSTQPTGAPLCILARTCPFHGMPPLQARFPRLHYVRFKSVAERDELATTIGQALGVRP